MTDDELPINHPLRPSVVVTPIRYHVHPRYGRAHVIDGGPCWCAPAVSDDWNLYDPADRPLLAARLRQIVGQFAAPDADRDLAVATLLGEFDRISHTAPPGVSQFEKNDEG